MSAGLAPLVKAPEGRIELSVLRLFVPEAPENNLSLSWATRVQASDAGIPFAFAQFTPAGAPGAIPGVANLHVKLAPGKLHVVDCRVEARVDQVIQFRFNHGTTSSVVSAVDGHVFAAFKAPRRVVFVASLPRTETGKIRRAELRRLAASLPADPSEG